MLQRRGWQVGGQLLVPHRLISHGPDWSTNKPTSAVIISRPKEAVFGIYRGVKGFYDEFTGMPLIEAAQEKVFRVQQSLIEVQNQKGPIKLELHRLRQQLQEANHSLQMCKKQDENYLKIIRRIVELNQREADEQEHFDQVEEDSRVMFADLMLAVQKSYELERNQTANFKYFSWIFSVVCGGLTFSALLFKYLTQTTEFRAMQKTMNAQENKILGEFQSVKEILNQQNLALGRIKLQQERELRLIEEAKRANKSSSSSSSLYAWLAWACSPLRPLKFW